MIESPADIKRICLVGVDPVGGSLVHGLRRMGYSGQVYGVIGANRLKLAWQRGIVADGSQQLDLGLEGTQLVVLSCMETNMRRRLADVWTRVEPETIIVDLSYMKGYVNAVYEESGRDDVRYVGIRLVGQDPSSTDLSLSGPFFFDERAVVLTPRDSTDLDAYAVLAKLLENVGAHVIAMSPQAHDQQIADHIHLPRLARLAALEHVYSTSEGTEMRADVLGADLVRDARQLFDLFHANWPSEVESLRAAVCRSLDQYLEGLRDLRSALADGKLDERVEKLLEAAAPTLDHAQISEVPKLVVATGDDTSTLERVSHLLAEAHLAIDNLERTRGLLGSSFKLTMNSADDRDRAVGLLKAAGIEAFDL